MLLYVVFCNIMKVNHFLHCFTKFLHLCFSFLYIKSLHVPFAYVSTKSINYILLLLGALNRILLTSSVNTLWFLLFFLFCWDLNTMFFLKTICVNFVLSRWIVYFHLEMLLNIFCRTLSYVYPHCHYLLSNYKYLHLNQQILSRFFCLFHL